MSAPSAPASPQIGLAASPGRDRLLVAWSAMGVILPCLIPNFGPVVLAMAIVAPLLLADRAVASRNIMTLRPITVLLAVICGYLCINVLLATATDNAAGAIATVAITAITVHVCIATYPAIALRDLKLMAYGLALGSLVVAGFFLIEYASRLAIQRAVQQAVEVFKLRGGRIGPGAWEEQLSITHMSRNLVVLVMVLWAALAFIAVTFAGTRRIAAMAALLLMTTVATFLSPSATAKMGLIAGAAVWVLTAFAPRVAAPLTYAAWTLISVGCIPIAMLIHRLRLYDIAMIGTSGRHRMMIWSASAEWFWRNPIMGLGVGGARVTNLNEHLHISAEGLGQHRLDWHAHNIFVQAWFETGAIGGLLLCLLGLMVLRTAFRLPDNVRPYAVATILSIFFIGLTGFSLWAAWYLAAYGLAALSVALAVFILRDEVPLPQGAAG